MGSIVIVLKTSLATTHLSQDTIDLQITHATEYNVIRFLKFTIDIYIQIDR